MKLLLASQSPRRRQLLAQLGLPLECISLDVDEHVPAGTPADGMAELLACRKAAACPDDMILDDTVVVAADTVVVLDGQPLGKPVSRQQAIDMLRALSGRHHSVYTGVCLCSRSRSVHFSERTDVFFRTLTDSEILHYVDTCRPFDKAGAYGIQEWIGMIGISRIEGCYYNVMGLPLAALWQHLRTLS